MKKIKDYFLLAILLFGIFLPFDFSLAQTCPNLTTVEGREATLVGEVTDLGGDLSVSAWFEYGQTENYGQKTAEKILTLPGLYCFKISDLKSCTTYHYRAVAKNSAGTSYGKNESFTTTCSSPSFTINKLVSNLSDNTPFLDSVEADPGEVISFSIEVKAGSTPIQNLILKDILPEKMNFQGNLKVDGISFSGDISLGLNLGNLASNQSKKVTFNALLSGSDQFPFGQTTLVNLASASSGDFSNSDTATIRVSKRAVAGAATTISTGLSNNLFFDSLLIPLVIAGVIIWLFKSKIINFEKWLDLRKRSFQEYKSKKALLSKVKEIKSREFPNL